MTSAIIDAADKLPMPAWLFVLLLVAVFIAASVVTGYITFKYRTKSSKGVQEKNDEKSAE